MIDFLNKIFTNMPVLSALNGNKTTIGILSLLAWYVHAMQPQLEPILMQVLGWVGFVMTPIGLVHKAIKNS